LLWGGLAAGYLLFLVLLWRFGADWNAVYGVIKLLVSFGQVSARLFPRGS
jgi:hypothetical protein